MHLIAWITDMAFYQERFDNLFSVLNEVNIIFSLYKDYLKQLF